MTSAPSARQHLGLAALGLGAACLHAATQVTSPVDESWFLQVLARVSDGAVLYRDVSFGATPLSIYVSALLTGLLGIEALVLKLMLALCFAGTLYFGLRSAAWLRVPRGAAGALCAAYVLYVMPGMIAFGAAYTALAMVLFAACFERTLAWHNTAQRRDVVLAAVLSGLCFAAKQNMGLLVLAALLTVVGVRDARAALRCALYAAVTIVIALMPVLFSGALAEMIDYGFTGKGAYVRLGGTGWLEGFLQQAAISDAGRRLYWSHQYLIAPIAFVVLGLAWRRESWSVQSVPAILMVFAAAALGCVFPRATALHLTIANPTLLLCIAWGISETPWIRRAVFVWLGAGLLALTATRARHVLSDDVVRPEIPHFRGALFEKSTLSDAMRASALMRAAAPSGEIFVVSPRAGFYYLVSGISNPTPYDYPYATTFGKHGQAEVADALRARRITACIDSAMDPAMMPRLIESALHAVPHCRISQ